jgi:hypothetical protein
MLKVMEVHRQDMAFEIRIGPKGMLVFFMDVPSYTRISTWSLSAFPQKFIRAAQHAAQSDFFMSEHYTVGADTTEYVGQFDGHKDEEFATLLFKVKYSLDKEVRIILRKTEIAKLVQIMEDYWTC